MYTVLCITYYAIQYTQYSITEFRKIYFRLDKKENMIYDIIKKKGYSHDTRKN